MVPLGLELRDEISAVVQWSMRKLMITGKERKMGNNYLLYQFMTSEELLHCSKPVDFCSAFTPSHQEFDIHWKQIEDSIRGDPVVSKS